MSVERDASPDGSDTTTASPDSRTPHAEDHEDPSAGNDSVRPGRLAALRRWARRGVTRWRSILATTFVVAAVGVALGIYLVVYRPDQRVSDATAHRASQAASDGAMAVLSYSYQHLHRDFAAAKSHLTGDFLAYYTKFTDDVLGPTAQQGQLTTTAKVVRAAVSDVHPDSAVVLVFVDQTTTSTQKKDPVTNKSAVVVTLTKVDGSWLIAKFDPVA